jgi:hypothetical protein
MDLFTDIQMAGLPAEQQARRAILYALQRIQGDPYIGYQMGLGTQAFSLLTEAAATLTGEPLEKLRRGFNAKNPRDPDAAFRALREMEARADELGIPPCPDPPSCGIPCTRCLIRQGLRGKT